MTLADNEETGAAPVLSENTENAAPTTQPQAVEQPPADARIVDNEGVAERNALIDAIKTTLPKAEEAGPEAKPADEPEAAADEPEAEETPDPTEEELEAIQKPGVKKWVRKALRQRNEARDQLAAVQPDAQAWQRHVTWLQEQQITPAESQQLYEVAAALKTGDYAAFMKIVGPFVERAQMATGERLPDDLRAAVDAGEVTEKYAREIAQTRSAAQSHQARATRAETAQQETRRAETINALRAAAQAEVVTLRATDADFDAKAALVEQLFVAKVNAAEMAGNAPASADAIKSLLRAAHSEVTATLARARPAPRPTASAPSSAASSSTMATRAPETAIEAAKLALAKMKTG